MNLVGGDDVHLVLRDEGVDFFLVNVGDGDNGTGLNQVFDKFFAYCTGALDGDGAALG